MSLWHIQVSSEQGLFVLSNQKESSDSSHPSSFQYRKSTT